MSRRASEWIVLAFALAFVGFLALSFRPGRRPDSSKSASSEKLPSAPVGSEAGEPTTVLRGFDYTESVRGKPIFHIQSERTVGFGPAAGLLPNLYALEKVTLTVYPETGDPVTVLAERATYDSRTNEAHLRGNVRWLDGKGALGETEEIDFQPSARRLVAPRAIRMTRGGFTLEASSGTYDVATREARLAGPVRGSGTGSGTSGLTSLAAREAVYRREDATIELTGDVSAGDRTGSEIRADRLVLKLEAESDRVDWARAEGHVRGRTTGALPSGSGTAAPAPGRAPQTYSGDQAGLFFAPDGSTRSLSLSGSPATIDEPGRKLRAPSIEVTMEAGKPRSARADGGVHIESEGSVADAKTATLVFSPAGDVETLDLSGAARMSGEGRRGSADRAVQVASRGIWILTGSEGTPATVEGEGSRVSAGKIEIDQKRKGLRAEGAVRAVLTPRSGASRPTTPIGDGARPTFAKADRMTVDDATRVATFSGGASLWQDASSLFGNDITLNDLQGTLVAVGNTRTVFSPIAGPAEPARRGAPAGTERDRRPSVITARRVVYQQTAGAAGAVRPGAATPTPAREGPSTALFEDSVVVTTAEWRASAAQAAATIGPDRRLDRVVLTGGVSFQDTRAGRSGRAERATDWPREGKTVLEGSPASVVDRDGNRVAGATLTITQRGGSVEVTAPEGGRTETIHKTRTQ